ncbi:MAG TPA: type II toxin-antitoxin system prevent-host-death family antitoxin [Caulobacteraceae bacterium]|nr:type II toxin-antitoxin system prevent-host-death family antitoxin [Caulobacteraceae bacterium]
MANYSVAEAKNHLPHLIRLATEGQEVVITRHGKPVAEIRARPQTARLPSVDRAEIYAWLRAERESRKPLDIDSVQLLNEMHDETDV